MPQKLLVGTTKGLVVLKKINQHWQIKQTHFLGMPVSIIYVNELTNTWWAGITHHHWGQKLHYSIDEGESWQAVAPPSYPLNAKIAANKPATAKTIPIDFG